MSDPCILKSRLGVGISLPQTKSPLLEQYFLFLIKMYVRGLRMEDIVGLDWCDTGKCTATTAPSSLN